MRTKKLLMMIALLCTIVQGAWAQTEVSSEETLRAAIGSNNSVKMTANIPLSSCLVIEDGKNVTLDLNGYVLSRSLSSAANDGHVILVNSGGLLTVTDGSSAGNGQITGGKAIDGGGICNNGTLTIEGGTITGCSANNCGGGIFNAPVTAAGDPATLTIKGGRITGNTCGDDDAGRGAGIYNYPGCTLYMQGATYILGNTKGDEANNVYLHSETDFINVTGALTGSSIGVSIPQSHRTFTSGYKTNNPTEDGATIFSNDNSASAISQNGDEMFYGTSATFNVRSWDKTNKQVVTTTVTKVCTPIEGSHPGGWITLTNGYYVVIGKVLYEVFTITGDDVHLILADGCQLNCRHIKLEQGNSLHIHSRSDGDNKGQLYAENDENTGSYYDGAAAIGGGDEQNSGSLYVHGGYVKALTLNNILYKGDAGIGGGHHHGIGGEVVIYGGKVEAIGDAGAGIGGGSVGSQEGPVTIYGGDVSAESTEGGAGIGGGLNRNGGSVYIYGGNVSAIGSNKENTSGSGSYNGSYSAGIGCGEDGWIITGDLHIYGGTVKPAGGQGSQCVTGSVEIVTGMKVTTNDGPVTAVDRVKTCYIKERWKGLTISPCPHDGKFIYPIINSTTHTRVCEYCNHTVEEAHTYTDDVCVCGQRYDYTLDIVTLYVYDTQDNSSTLATINKKTVNVVTLFGRTLYKDGSWNTLCLPFSLNAEEVSTQLNPTKLKTLGSTSFNSETGTLTLNFIDATTIEAGKPYIIKWTSGEDKTDPSFSNVTIDNDYNAVTTDYVNFVGSFSPISLAVGDKTVLYLGAGNKLYYPSAAKTVNACRAVFALKGLTADEKAKARAFVLNFGDESTGITTTNDTNDTNSDGAWFTLDGRKLSQKPSQHGIYIKNGKKVVIK